MDLKDTIVIGVVNKVEPEKVYLSVKNATEHWGVLPRKNMVKSVDENNSITLKKHDQVEVAVHFVSKNGIIVFSEKAADAIKKRAHNEKQAKLFNVYSKELQCGGIYECVITSVSQKRVKLTCGEFENCIVNRDEIAYGNQDLRRQNYREGQYVDAVFLSAEGNTLYFSLKRLRENPYSEQLCSLEIDDLLRFMGIEHNKFAGRAAINEKNALLTDVISYNNKEDETLSGNLLIDPISGEPIKALFDKDVDLAELEDGASYEVELTVAPIEKRQDHNNPFLFRILRFKKLNEDPYRHIVNEVFMKSDNPHSNATIARLLEEVGKQMYSSKDRTFFELLQNADDAAAPMSNNSVQVVVDQADRYLLFCHNGCPFNRNDFVSISSAANSTKRKAGNKTGYKGIGFKSVFSDAESVILSSGGFSVKFDKNNPLLQNYHDFYYKARGCKSEEDYKRDFSKFSDDEKNFRGVSDMPWQILPIWEDNLPQLPNFDKKWNVNIAIQTNVIEHYKDSISTLAKQPEFLLFLRNTKRLTIFGHILEKENTQHGSIVLRSEAHTRRYSKTDYDDVEISNEVFSKYNGLNLEIRKVNNQTTGQVELHFFENGQDKSSTIPNKLAEAQHTVISFVTQIDDGQIVVKNTQSSTAPIFAYLPTSDRRFPFPFFVNADFVLSSNREAISGDNPWNIYLFAVIGERLVRWVSELAKSGSRDYLNLLLPNMLSTQSSDCNRLSEFFNASYSNALKHIPFVVNNKWEVVKTSEIIIDKTDLSDVIGADDFLAIIGSEKTLPSKNINWQILRNELFNVECISLSQGENNLYALLSGNEKLYAWVEQNSETDKGTQFFEWLNTRIKHDWGLGNSSPIWSTLAKELPLIRVNGILMSAKEVNAKGCLILNKSLSYLKPLLLKLGLCIADQLDEECPVVSVANVDYEKLLNQVNASITKTQLSPIEKKQLFLAEYRNSKAKNILNETGLFSNKAGERKPLYSMFYNPSVDYDYLSNYQLAEDEYSTELNQYLLKERQEIFTKILIPNIRTILSCVGFDTLYSDWEQNWSDEATRAVMPMLENEEYKTKLIFNSRSSKLMVDYLESMPMLRLRSDTKYDAGSQESMILQIALKTRALPSFISKVYVDSHRVSDFLVNDTLSIVVYNRSYLFSLFEILPEKKSNILETIKQIVPDIASADIECRSLTPLAVVSELKAYLQRTQTVTLPQFLFISAIKTARNHFGDYDLTPLCGYHKNWSLADCIKCCYDHFGSNSSEILSAGINGLGINTIKGLFIDNSKFILPEEFVGTKHPDIMEWADNPDKKAFLAQLGVLNSGNNEMIRWRKSFFNKTTNETSLKEEQIPATFQWISSCCGGFPVNQDNEPARADMLIALPNIKSSSYDDDNEQTQEFDLPQYQDWRKKGGGLRIVLTKGNIVWRALYNDKHIASYRKGSYCLYTNATLLVNGDGGASKVKSLLYEFASVSNYSKFTEQDYQDLFFVDSSMLNETVRQRDALQDKLKQLEQFGSLEDITTLLQKYGSLDNLLKMLSRQGTVEIDTPRSVSIGNTAETEQNSTNIRTFLEGGYDISNESIKSEHQTTRFRILQFLKSNFKIDGSFDEKAFLTEATKFQSIPLSDGRSVFPQSAKYGIWYLSSNIWREVVDHGNIACVCTGDNSSDFHIFDSKEQIRECIERKPNSLIKVSGNSSHPVSEAVDSVFPSEAYDENTHLMLMLKPTPNAEINSLFSDVFETNQENTADF